MSEHKWDEKAAEEIYENRTKAKVETTYAKTTTTHDTMDPRRMKGGRRESRDSKTNPITNALAVLFDHTASMKDSPKVFAMKLGNLMRFLVSHHIIENPQILFGAFGDAKYDKSPFQVGQFESDTKMDDDLMKLHLEGGGGGNAMESAELALYFAARKVDMDCHEKRGKKGYLFILSDEPADTHVRREEIFAIFGDRVEADIPIKDIIAEAQKKFEVFYVYVHSNFYGESTRTQFQKFWTKLLGERVIHLESFENVCELIATQVGLCEGHDLDDLRAMMTKSGFDPSAVNTVSKAVVLSAGGAAGLVKGGVTGALDKPSGPVGASKRL